MDELTKGIGIFKILDTMTDKQRRRYELRLQGLTIIKIAEIEHTTKQAISKSLLSAIKKAQKKIKYHQI